MSRSSWKNLNYLLNKQQCDKSSAFFKNQSKLIAPRNLEITNQMVGTTVIVYNGKENFSLLVLESMISHKVGEFVPTRKLYVFQAKKKRKKQKKK